MKLKSKNIIKKCSICYKSRNSMKRKNNRFICNKCNEEYKELIEKDIK